MTQQVTEAGDHTACRYLLGRIPSLVGMFVVYQ